MASRTTPVLASTARAHLRSTPRSREGPSHRPPWKRTGGILGLGEEEKDRIGLLHELASLKGGHPESVPINALVAVEGTPIGSVAAECRVSQTFVKSMVTLFEQAMQESLRPSSALALSAWRSRIDATLRHRRAIWMPTLCGSSPLGFAGPAGPRWASEAG